MNLNLHIERLVLEGLPAGGAQGAMVQTAIETELARLLANGDLGSWTSGAMASLPAQRIQLDPDSKPELLGRQVAQAVRNQLAGVPSMNRAVEQRVSPVLGEQAGSAATRRHQHRGSWSQSMPDSREGGCP